VLFEIVTETRQAPNIAPLSGGSEIALKARQFRETGDLEKPNTGSPMNDARRSALVSFGS